MPPLTKGFWAVYDHYVDSSLHLKPHELRGYFIMCRAGVIRNRGASYVKWLGEFRNLTLAVGVVGAGRIYPLLYLLMSKDLSAFHLNRGLPSYYI